MAKYCAFCGKTLGLLSQSFSVLNGSGAELCSDCSTRQAHLVEAFEKKSQKDIENAIADIKNNSKNSKDVEVYIGYIMQRLEEIADRPRQREEAEKRRLAEIEEATRKKAEQNLIAQKAALMTTVGFSFEGYRIIEYLDIVTGETVLGTGFLSELSASWADTFGETSGRMSSKLSRAKEIAFDVAKVNCIEKGGNAIIGVDFDYLTFANNMIGVVSNGTAVRIEKLSNEKS